MPSIPLRCSAGTRHANPSPVLNTTGCTKPCSTPHLYTGAVAQPHTYTKNIRGLNTTHHKMWGQTINPKHTTAFIPTIFNHAHLYTNIEPYVTSTSQAPPMKKSPLPISQRHYAAECPKGNSAGVRSQK